MAKSETILWKYHTEVPEEIHRFVPMIDMRSCTAEVGFYKLYVFYHPNPQNKEHPHYKYTHFIIMFGETLLLSSYKSKMYLFEGGATGDAQIYMETLLMDHIKSIKDFEERHENN